MVGGRLLGLGEVSEYRVTIREARGLPELSVEIETIPECVEPALLAKNLQLRFETALSLRVPVTSVAAGVLPRFDMKSKRWIRL